MQSSPLMAFRATVIVVCLVAVPLVAVFGTLLPQLLRPSGALLADRHADHPRHNRPRHVEHNAINVARATPPPTGSGSQPADLPRAAAAAVAHDQPVRRGRKRSAGGGPGVSITAVRPLLPPPSGQFWAAGESPAPPHRQAAQPTLRATAYSQPARAQKKSGWQARVPPEIVHGQQRLRELGAVEYRLETWGEQGNLFRFQCRMPSGGGSPAQRHFEATDPDPSAAVISVVREVERWRQLR